MFSEVTMKKIISFVLLMLAVSLACVGPSMAATPTPVPTATVTPIPGFVITSTGVTLSDGTVKIQKLVITNPVNNLVLQIIEIRNTNELYIADVQSDGFMGKFEYVDTLDVENFGYKLRPNDPTQGTESFAGVIALANGIIVWYPPDKYPEEPDIDTQQG